MRLNDILKLQDYNLDSNSTVEIFDMDNFSDAVKARKFKKIIIPQDESTEIYPYAFLINSSILIAMEAD